ncbi:DsbA family protein [Corynebacterium pseudotuberculosis]|uniref:Thioredoxin domain-containing protein n=1 Tax=Corynebacterium pseudotuberculosis (strain C231) TaxID=681645 RepID=A0A6D2LW79_CORP2|nr:thioredoxin domain-containing protein [Corynebacterium pseudotuberculosis]ADK29481.1 thioredoxin domain-containing protein [Corynebacterium pseudotuberculosis FRC41]ADL21555.1 thioredoxin domain-containing protein [Corynebacterium pseudotuberculosis 1002]ADO26950.1 thioredoxin domain-containing protein [Corynebacterium pseudotuberculosis I19]AEK93014.1 DsbG protein [Corynebacterium pseudotuberculosis PAT10]AEP70918.1 DsbG protein [Corynebacterium pseudotuberculosis 42/02-A]
MSSASSVKKVKNPTEKSNGFLWALLALLVVVIAVVAFIVIQGRGAQAEKFADRERETISFTGEVTDNAIQLKAANVKSDAKKIDLYEDYSCSHCAELGKATDNPMKEAIEKGEIVVNLRFLNFLDRGNEDGSSSKGGAAALAIANAGEWDAYWNYRTLLMEEQNSIYGKWSNEDFANAAKNVGASDGVVQKIRDGAEKQHFLDAAKANTDKLEKDSGKVSSPRVFIDGKEVTEKINTWVTQATS